VRQRLSSEPDRYRGRRRAPTPPRGRYAAVVTSAFVGAGVVAAGAASQFPDAKAVNPTVLAGLEHSAATAGQLAERAADADRASRGTDRTLAAPAPKAAVDQNDVYLLPLDDFQFTAPFGVRWGKLHAGIDLSAPEGTPYHAIHAGLVTKAGYDGGYGYAVTVLQPDGTEIIYGHSRRLLVQQGQQVKAGDVLGEVGDTGYSYGAHLHVEIHKNGVPRDPVTELRKVGVDVQLGVESVYTNLDS
jgi:murein DD-endopeptidase MepM/ murein hydrolase activator NlpD